MLHEVLRIEKLEIIRTVETSPLPVRRTLAQIGIPKSTFYAWLDRHVAAGFDDLEDRKPRSERVWHRIPDDVRRRLSPREIAVTFTDPEQSYVSEASVYRLLRFANPTTAINRLWQTDFTYLKVTGWGWYYLSTLLDDFSRYIVAFRLCTTMAAADVTATLDLIRWRVVAEQPRPPIDLDLIEAGGLQRQTNRGMPSVRYTISAITSAGSSFISGKARDGGSFSLAKPSERLARACAEAALFDPRCPACDAAVEACSKPPIANRVMSSVSSSTNGWSMVMPNGSCANSSRLRTKTPHWPISQMATHRAIRFSVSGGKNRRTISVAAVR
jgi:hypothetical protein